MLLFSAILSALAPAAIALAAAWAALSPNSVPARLLFAVWVTGTLSVVHSFFLLPLGFFLPTTLFVVAAPFVVATAGLLLIRATWGWQFVIRGVGATFEHHRPLTLRQLLGYVIAFAVVFAMMGFLWKLELRYDRLSNGAWLKNLREVGLMFAAVATVDTLVVLPAAGIVWWLPATANVLISVATGTVLGIAKSCIVGAFMEGLLLDIRLIAVFVTYHTAAWIYVMMGCAILNRARVRLARVGREHP